MKHGLGAVAVFLGALMTTRTSTPSTVTYSGVQRIASPTHARILPTNVSGSIGSTPARLPGSTPHQDVAIAAGTLCRGRWLAVRQADDVLGDGPHAGDRAQIEGRLPLDPPVLIVV